MAETQEELKERMARVRAARGRSGVPAGVGQGVSEFAAPISPDVEFAARNANRRIATQGPIDGEGDGLTGGAGVPAGTVTHTRTATVVMYKPDGHGHFTPRHVPATSIAMNLLSGFHSVCPECQGHHGADPNDCPARERTAVRLCPICGKRIYDNLKWNEVEDDGTDPNIIRDDSLDTSTAASRTLASLHRHMWLRHPTESAMLGTPVLPNMDAVMADAGVSR